jgi:lipopolysaccharide biosynthesis protein
VSDQQQPPKPITPRAFRQQALRTLIRQPVLALKVFRHLLQHGLKSAKDRLARDVFAEVDPHSLDAARLLAQIQANLKPGDQFEAEPIRLQGQPLARVFAYYLPQFHPIPENDAWWGEGFTEWRNVTRAMPRFVGHIQPRLPAALGFYDLRQPQVMERQIELAQNAGISGFAFYYYRFGGRRLMEGPLEQFMQQARFPFKLIWANESWTRHWDGGNGDVLLAQAYPPSDDLPLVDDLARHFAHPSYERLDGRPLLTIYRAAQIPNAAQRIAYWRQLFRERHQLNPILLMAQSFQDVDPRPYGLDGAVEFPPHLLTAGLPAINSQLVRFEANYRGHYRHYQQLVQASLKQATPPFPLIRTAAPSWDNEPRYPGGGTGLVEANPRDYQAWLLALAQAAQQNPFMDQQPYVFVNAWNEWAEGAFLEPDLHYGYAYLNATARALMASPAPS